MQDVQNKKIGAPQFEAMLNGISDGITVLDMNGHYIYVNNAAAHTCGFLNAAEFLQATPQQVIGRFEIQDEAGNPFELAQLPGRLVLQGNYNPPEVIVQFPYRNKSEARWW